MNFEKTYTKSIILTKADVNAFVLLARNCSFDISLSFNRYKADAKSMLEVMSIDFSKILTLEYNGYDPLFELYLDRYLYKVPEQITA